MATDKSVDVICELVDRLYEFDEDEQNGPELPAKLAQENLDLYRKALLVKAASMDLVALQKALASELSGIESDLSAFLEENA